MIAGLPGVEHLATSHMRKEMEKADLPPVREFLKILDDSGAELYACQLAMQVFKRTREQLVPQVKGVISAMDFYDKSQGAQILFI
jgi:peroxiredoxin family protein